MFSLDVSNIKMLESDLKTFASRAYPFATKQTVNRAAFSTQKLAKRRIGKQFITRNQFTARSVQVDQARTLAVSRQAAVVGSIADYMADQELGGTKRMGGKHGVPIATSYAAGQGMDSQPRTRLPRKPNRMQNISLRRGRTKRPKNSRQALLFKVQDAVKSGRRQIFHDGRGNKKQGIFKVVGGSKSFKRGWPRNAKLRMLWDMSEQSVRVPKDPWLAPTVRRVEKRIPFFYREALTFQANRIRLFKTK